ncbi:unnamed protein product [Protopolystoma xenopodis]|uniref:Uncharacterized protein n=1 Tax=Protopolystoma xenopodis TaxID=117903 RepID=A0A448XEE2_9PLAT|nr:unnamed protein product [Protopolystoma xenopodis]
MSLCISYGVITTSGFSKLQFNISTRSITMQSTVGIMLLLSLAVLSGKADDIYSDDGIVEEREALRCYETCRPLLQRCSENCEVAEVCFTNCLEENLPQERMNQLIEGGVAKRYLNYLGI